MSFYSERRRAGMTLEGVADAIGVKRQSVWAWEHSRNLPRGSRLLALCELYGCELNDLLEKEGGKNDDES